MMNKQKPIRIGYIGFCLIGGSRYNFMVGKSQHDLCMEENTCYELKKCGLVVTEKMIV